MKNTILPVYYACYNKRHFLTQHSYTRLGVCGRQICTPLTHPCRIYTEKLSETQPSRDGPLCQHMFVCLFWVSFLTTIPYTYCRGNREFKLHLYLVSVWPWGSPATTEFWAQMLPWRVKYKRLDVLLWTRKYISHSVFICMSPVGKEYLFCVYTQLTKKCPPDVDQF